MMDEAIDDLRQQKFDRYKKQIRQKLKRAWYLRPISSSLDGVDETSGRATRRGLAFQSSDGFSSGHDNSFSRWSSVDFVQTSATTGTGFSGTESGYRDRGGSLFQDATNRTTEIVATSYLIATSDMERTSVLLRWVRSSFWNNRGGVRIGPNFNVWW